MTEETLPESFRRLVALHPHMRELLAEMRGRYQAAMAHSPNNMEAARVASQHYSALATLLDYAERLGLFQYVPCGERFATPKEQAVGAYKAVLFRLPDAKDES